MNMYSKRSVLIQPKSVDPRESEPLLGGRQAPGAQVVLVRELHRTEALVSRLRARHGRAAAAYRGVDYAARLDLLREAVRERKLVGEVEYTIYTL